MKVNIPLAFYMPLEPMFVFLKEMEREECRSSFCNHFVYKNMTRNVLVIVNRAVCAGSIGRMLWIFDITLLPQTGLDELCTIQAKSKMKIHKAGKTLRGAIFIKMLCWILFPMDFASSGEWSASWIHYKRKLTCSDIIFKKNQLHSEKLDIDKDGTADCVQSCSALPAADPAVVAKYFIWDVLRRRI